MFTVHIRKIEVNENGSVYLDDEVQVAEYPSLRLALVGAAGRYLELTNLGRGMGEMVVVREGHEVVARIGYQPE